MRGKMMPWSSPHFSQQGCRQYVIFSGLFIFYNPLCDVSLLLLLLLVLKTHVQMLLYYFALNRQIIIVTFSGYKTLFCHRLKSALVNCSGV